MFIAWQKQLATEMFPERQRLIATAREMMETIDDASLNSGDALRMGNCMKDIYDAILDARNPSTSSSILSSDTLMLSKIYSKGSGAFGDFWGIRATAFDLPLLVKKYVQMGLFVKRTYGNKLVTPTVRLPSFLGFHEFKRSIEYQRIYDKIVTRLIAWLDMPNATKRLVAVSSQKKCDVLWDETPSTRAHNLILYNFLKAVFLDYFVTMDNFVFWVNPRCEFARAMYRFLIVQGVQVPQNLCTTMFTQLITTGFAADVNSKLANQTDLYDSFIAPIGWPEHEINQHEGLQSTFSEQIPVVNLMLICDFERLFLEVYCKLLVDGQ